MEGLTDKQVRALSYAKPLVSQAPWILRITEQKSRTGPVIVICQRQTKENGKKVLFEYGRLYESNLRACRGAIRYIISQVMDAAGRPLYLQDLIDAKTAYRGKLPLDEVAGAKLALLVKLSSQSRSPERVELMAWRIERFSREEAMYWLGKVSVEPLLGRRGTEWAKSGLRTMLAGKKKDAAEVRELLVSMRKEAK